MRQNENPWTRLASFLGTPVEEHHQQCSLSLDASNMSSPEDLFSSSRVTLPVPFKICTPVVSAEAGDGRGREGGGGETPTVFHCRGLPAMSRNGGRLHPAASQANHSTGEGAWRQRRARQLRSLRAACVLLWGAVGLARPRCLRLLGKASWWRRFRNWQQEGRLRVALALAKVLGLGWRWGLLWRTTRQQFWSLELDAEAGALLHAYRRPPR